MTEVTIVFSLFFLIGPRLCARPSRKVSGRLGIFALQAIDEFGYRRRIGNLPDALAAAPDVLPGLDLHVAARAEVHLGLVGHREIVGIETGRSDGRAEIVAMNAGEQVGVDRVM